MYYIIISIFLLKWFSQEFKQRNSFHDVQEVVYEVPDPMNINKIFSFPKAVKLYNIK
jgi:hypothetical protein